MAELWLLGQRVRFALVPGVRSAFACFRGELLMPVNLTPPILSSKRSNAPGIGSRAHGWPLTAPQAGCPIEQANNQNSDRLGVSSGLYPPSSPMIVKPPPPQQGSPSSLGRSRSLEGGESGISSPTGLAIGGLRGKGCSCGYHYRQFQNDKISFHGFAHADTMLFIVIEKKREGRISFQRAQPRTVGVDPSYNRERDLGLQLGAMKWELNLAIVWTNLLTADHTHAWKAQKRTRHPNQYRRSTGKCAGLTVASLLAITRGATLAPLDSFTPHRDAPPTKGKYIEARNKQKFMHVEDGASLTMQRETHRNTTTSGEEKIYNGGAGRDGRKCPIAFLFSMENAWAKNIVQAAPSNPEMKMPIVQSPPSFSPEKTPSVSLRLIRERVTMHRNAQPRSPPPGVGQCDSSRDCGVEREKHIRRDRHVVALQGGLYSSVQYTSRSGSGAGVCESQGKRSAASFGVESQKPAFISSVDESNESPAWQHVVQMLPEELSSLKQQIVWTSLVPVYLNAWRALQQGVIVLRPHCAIANAGRAEGAGNTVRMYEETLAPHFWATLYGNGSLVLGPFLQFTADLQTHTAANLAQTVIATSNRSF
ncbi:uncharacterized protein EV422DRAFT_506300 [Fimicolochytrium jonesii]|uniref:uncharacterized protein n=1 Tax=Fimicolochytrium jonesii TaxID=1396493 RepID=UPI0022FF157C|nr:uncharacterized protein EV422DRAFT_506300 [Fimicolochytrium jonesii]KAI8821082.1 hypothetical protein EV422DRAFT_506300 [Fimicolochytrium jonesii]